MAAHYALSYWEAIELFCKCVDKYEAQLEEEDVKRNDTKRKKYKQEFSLANFKSYDAIQNALNKYASATACQDLKIKSEVNIYKLGLNIRENKPVVFSEREMLALLKYSGAKGERYRSITPKSLSSAESSTQRVFEGTKWCLYNFDEYERADRPGEVIQGITRAIVTFSPFARVKIDNYRPIGRPEEEYKGYYEIYDKNYLKLNLTINQSYDKDLTILLALGKEEPGKIDLMLGQYHNIDKDYIYSGTLILERTTETLQPYFFVKGGPVPLGEKQIKKPIWRYFSDKWKNRIRVKNDINSIESLEYWLNLRRGGGSDDIPPSDGNSPS